MKKLVQSLIVFTAFFASVSAFADGDDGSYPDGPPTLSAADVGKN